MRECVHACASSAACKKDRNAPERPIARACTQHEPNAHLRRRDAAVDLLDRRPLQLAVPHIKHRVPHFVLDRRTRLLAAVVVVLVGRRMGRRLELRRDGGPGAGRAQRAGAVELGQVVQGAGGAGVGWGGVWGLRGGLWVGWGVPRRGTRGLQSNLSTTTNHAPRLPAAEAYELRIHHDAVLISVHAARATGASRPRQSSGRACCCCFPSRDAFAGAGRAGEPDRHRRCYGCSMITQKPIHDALGAPCVLGAA
jgi:hypothetical protein